MTQHRQRIVAKRQTKWRLGNRGEFDDRRSRFTRITGFIAHVSFQIAFHYPNRRRVGLHGLGKRHRRPRPIRTESTWLDNRQFDPQWLNLLSDGFAETFNRELRRVITRETRERAASANRRDLQDMPRTLLPEHRKNGSRDIYYAPEISVDLAFEFIGGHFFKR